MSVATGWLEKRVQIKWRGITKTQCLRHWHLILVGSPLLLQGPRLVAFLTSLWVEA